MEIRLLSKGEIRDSLPLIKLLNPGLEESLLLQRLEEMEDTAYKCAGLIKDGEIIGLCGLWENVRFYSGRQIEVDNVIIHPKYRNGKMGDKLMQWVYQYARERSCNTVELNTYVHNSGSHKFYFNQGFAILGFHMKKILQ